MEITSRKNPAVLHLKELVREKKARRESGEFLIEGQKLAREAVSAGLDITGAYATKNAMTKYPEACAEIEAKCGIITISEDVSEAVCDTKTPQGIFLTAKLLDKIPNSVTILAYKKIIVLDNLQDTGNVGTVIRTADAMGIDALIVSSDTADIYSPKVVRGAMGSLFRLPVFTGELSELLPTLTKGGFDVYAAMLDSAAQELGSFAFSEKSAAVIGNEGNGISPATAACCNKKVYIPIKNAESLNAGVAASIICWELGKQHF